MDQTEPRLPSKFRAGALYLIPEIYCTDFFSLRQSFALNFSPNVLESLNLHGSTRRMTTSNHVANSMTYSHCMMS